MKYLKCSYCKQTKPETEFSVNNQVPFRGNRSYACLPCGRENYQKARKRNPEIRKRANAKNRERWAKDPSMSKKHRELAYLRRYGITIARYNEILQQQDGKCKICGLEASENTYGKLYIDHDHYTGTIRGLLCRSCNIGIAHVKNVDWLAKAGKYLNLTHT